MVFLKLNSILIVSSVMLNLLKASMSSKKEWSKHTLSDECFDIPTTCPPMQKDFYQSQSFPILLIKSSFKADFRLYIKQQGILKKSLSTFQPFTSFQTNGI